jgi:hypothetical protein
MDPLERWWESNAMDAGRCRNMDSDTYGLFFLANTTFACAKHIWKSKEPMKCMFFYVVGCAQALSNCR